MKKINIMIVDDRDINRDLLVLLLKRHHHFNIIAEATNGEEAIEKIKSFPVDVVIMDINMPIMNGIQAAKKIKKISPSVKILFNSFYEDYKYISEVLNSGASGFIKKGESITIYVDAINRVYKNDVFLSDDIKEKIKKNVINFSTYTVQLNQVRNTA